MAKTARQILTIKDPGGLIAVPVKSGETIYGGTLAVVGKDGYLYNLDSAAVNEATIVGFVADDSANTTGPAATTASGSIASGLEDVSAIAGDKTVRWIYTKGQVKFTATSITQAMLGTTMYASDNYTFDEGQSGGVAIGYLSIYLSATSGYVCLNEFAENRASGLRMIRGAITAATTTTGGDAISVANPTGKTCIIERMIIDVTTQATGAAKMDVGVASDGTTSSDTLIDGADVGTAAILADNITDAGTNGGATVKWASTQYVTATPSATLAGLVGTYAIFYRLWQ